MPCFSASNVRFISAEQQRDYDAAIKKATMRAKTATRPNMNYVSPSILDLKNKEKTCYAYFHQQLDVINPQQARKPGEKPSQNKRKLLHSRELQRMKEAARELTLDDRLNRLQEAEQLMKQREENAKHVRRRFAKIDEVRIRLAESKVEKEDLFGANEKKKVLEKTFLAKQEQEEEVKRVNRIILNAKCHVVRDAQVMEKNEMEKELRAESLRMDMEANERAAKLLQNEDMQLEKQRADRRKYADAIKEQLMQRENLRFLEAERIQQEAQLMRDANEAVKRDEERMAQIARQRRQEFRKELQMIIEMSEVFKKSLAEQELEADMRIQAFLRQLRLRERALEIEKKLEKEAFDRNQKRLYVLVSKMRESKSQREELTYAREQERLEREYRRKEKEAALRKHQLIAEIREARTRQLEETKHRQALQIARAEQDFNTLIDRLKLEECKQQKLDKQRQERRIDYRKEIINQINSRELARRRMVEDEKLAAAAWRESEKLRGENIRAVIENKLKAMREACMPEKYIAEVEKQIRRISRKL